MLCLSLIGFLVMMGGDVQQDLVITTHGDLPEELVTRDLFQQMIGKYDLEPWTFTTQIQIKDGVIPHSHPILTLSTSYRTEETKAILLSTYIHEQLHWHLVAREKKVAEALKVLARKYPEVPVKGKQGARSERSTRLHLILCFLEWQGVKSLLEPDEIRRVEAHMTSHHYTWIYTTMMADASFIADLIEMYDLDVLQVKKD